MANFSVLVAALIAGSASAFAPSAVQRTNVALQSTSDDFCMGMVGAEGPEPMPFIGKTSVNFDPVGFTEVCRLS